MATALAGKLFIVNKALYADKYTAILTSCAHSYLSTKGKNMQKTVLNEVYDLLKKIGAVDNESEFSTDWLARSECYMRTLRFKQANPSMGTLSICASKLQHYASCMTATDANIKLGKQFVNLANSATHK